MSHLRLAFTYTCVAYMNASVSVQKWGAEVGYAKNAAASAAGRGVKNETEFRLLRLSFFSAKIGVTESKKKRP